MTEQDAMLLRARINELETEMMEFRSSMAKVLSSLYDTVHRLESRRMVTEHDTTRRLIAMRDCITNHFDLSEFKSLCFDMGINYDNLDGDSLEDKAREFVLLMNRLGRCPEIVAYCQKKRPNAKFVL